MRPMSGRGGSAAVSVPLLVEAAAGLVVVGWDGGSGVIGWGGRVNLEILRA